MEKRTTISVVTQLRGIASLLVFLFHFVCVSNNFINNQLLQSVFYYGKYGVQFFFVISGFVITYSMIKGNYRINQALIFFKKRIIRVEPPYLIVLLLTVALLYLKYILGMMSVLEHPPGFYQILLHIGYLVPFSNYDWLSIVFWTLAIEFQFYLLFSLLFVTFTYTAWLRALIIAVLIGCYFFSGSAQSFFYWSPIFLLGVLLALFKANKLALYELPGYAIVLFILIFYKLGWINLLFSVVPFVIILINPVIKSRVLTFLGEISYSLYLLHTLVAFSVINLFFMYGGESIASRIAFGISAVALTIGASYLLYIWVEKPCKNLASRISYSNKISQ